MTPEEVIEEIKQSNLRGRGGAGFQQLLNGVSAEMLKVKKSIFSVMQMKVNPEHLKIE